MFQERSAVWTFAVVLAVLVGYVLPRPDVALAGPAIVDAVVTDSITVYGDRDLPRRVKEKLCHAVSNGVLPSQVAYGKKTLRLARDFGPEFCEVFGTVQKPGQLIDKVNQILRLARNYEAAVGNGSVVRSALLEVRLVKEIRVAWEWDNLLRGLTDQPCLEPPRPVLALTPEQIRSTTVEVNDWACPGGTAAW